MTDATLLQDLLAYLQEQCLCSESSGCKAAALRERIAAELEAENGKLREDVEIARLREAGKL